MGGTIPFVAGCAGGLAQTPALCFADAAKCNLQVDGGKFASGAYAATFRRRVQALGVQKAFLPGLGVTALREVPSYGVYFLVYDTVKERLSHLLMPTAAVLIAGGLAGLISLTPFHPLDVAKSRLMVSSDPGATAWSIAREGWASEGRGFFFRGFAPFVCRTVILNAATFLGFEEALRRLQ